MKRPCLSGSTSTAPAKNIRLKVRVSCFVNGIVEDKVSAKQNGLLTNGFANGHAEVVVPEVSEEQPVLEQLPLKGTGAVVSPIGDSNTSLFDICPECGGGSLAYEEGCKKCYSCGYSEC